MNFTYENSEFKMTGKNEMGGECGHVYFVFEMIDKSGEHPPMVQACKTEAELAFMGGSMLLLMLEPKDGTVSPDNPTKNMEKFAKNTLMIKSFDPS